MSAAALVLLVGIDGSEASMHAVRHALRLSRETRCRLHLCHVQPDGEPRSPQGDVLRAAREAVLAAGGEAEAEVMHGDPAHELARHAREIGADLILLGTRGLNPAKQLLLGSVVRRTLELAHCPVVTAR